MLDANPYLGCFGALVPAGALGRGRCKVGNVARVGKAAAQDIGLSERRILTGLLLLKSSRS